MRGSSRGSSGSPQPCARTARAFWEAVSGEGSRARTCTGAGSRKSRGEERPGHVRAAALNLKMERCSRNQPPNSPQSLYPHWGERPTCGPPLGALGRLRAKSHPHPRASFSGSKASLDNLRGTKNVSGKELVGKNTPDVTEVCTQQHGIHTQTSWALFQTRNPPHSPPPPPPRPFLPTQFQSREYGADDGRTRACAAPGSCTHPSGAGEEEGRGPSHVSWSEKDQLGNCSGVRKERKHLFEWDRPRLYFQGLPCRWPLPWERGLAWLAGPPVDRF